MSGVTHVVVRLGGSHCKLLRRPAQETMIYSVTVHKKKGLNYALFLQQNKLNK